MVKEDILGGIKNAIARGSSLKDAMQSYYNAGYSKEEIEQAAREYQMQYSSQSQQSQKIIQPAPTSPKSLIQNTKPNPQANFKKYEQKSNNKLGWIIFFIVLLIIVISAAVLLFVFKDKIINLINNSA